MEDKHRFVDELLDSALAQQRRVEPRPGLEGRILARVRVTANEHSAGKKTWKLWLAAAATAAAVVFVAIHVARRPQSPSVQRPQAGNAVSSPAPRETLAANSEAAPKEVTAPALLESKRTARHESKPSHRVEAHHWPSQFPTPAPLSPEEKALVRYVQQTPPQVLAEPILTPESATQHVEIKPLEIRALEIKPLALGSGREKMQ